MGPVSRAEAEPDVPGAGEVIRGRPADIESISGMTEVILLRDV